ncbi:MAG: type II toxin-antitoxin system Phd/YefM family antitoxin [Proteobacteria bacterium]|nr:type II toxin-antitoxin system Phd/YefM family antitoxin [Pseudomonadota bacterium]
MKTLNIHETKTNLSAILKEIEETGNKFLICRNGKPIAEIVPHKNKNRLKTDAFLSQVNIKCNLTEPLTEDEWDV